MILYAALDFLTRIATSSQNRMISNLLYFWKPLLLSLDIELHILRSYSVPICILMKKSPGDERERLLVCYRILSTPYSELCLIFTVAMIFPWMLTTLL